MSNAIWRERAQKVLPAGGFGNLDHSVIVQKAQGSRIWDEDGKEYIDFLNSSGPLILGHAHPEVMDAVKSQLGKGTTYYANSAVGIELAEVICAALPSAEQLRYVSTGGEADMYAIRLARAYTGRDKILKFEGGYHGMSAEAQMSLAPTTLVNFPNAVPDSAGIPDSVRQDMLIAPFNDANTAEALMSEHAAEIAAVIVEPLQRLIPPQKGFLDTLRAACTKHGILLIFDEIVTGFRFDYGGAQTLYGVTPDITVLGKIIGGGFPLAAIVSSAEIMKCFDKSQVGSEQFLMHSGTLSGNPVAAIAGLKTLEILRRDGAYDQLRNRGKQIMSMIAKHLSAANVDHQIVGDRTLFDVIFTDQQVNSYRDIFHADTGRAAQFNNGLRENGILKSPGKIYPSLAHTDEDMEETEGAIITSVKTIF